MTKRAKTRLIKILFILCMTSAGVFMILYNLQENIVFFYPPSKIPFQNTNKIIKVGGLVKENSIKKIKVNEIEFVVTDNVRDVTVKYTGLLPALFREKQGIIASGKFINNIFIASNLFTKHDENYMPPEIAKSLKKE